MIEITAVYDTHRWDEATPLDRMAEKDFHRVVNMQAMTARTQVMGRFQPQETDPQQRLLAATLSDAAAFAAINKWSVRQYQDNH
jgi:hypothetical protein